MSPNLRQVQSDTARRRQAERSLSFNSSARQTINWPMIRGAFVTLVLCCFLLGLLAVGK